MYKFLAPVSKAAEIGATWAGKDSRGGMALVIQSASLNEELGVTTNWSPVLNVLSRIRDGLQTVKHVG